MSLIFSGLFFSFRISTMRDEREGWAILLRLAFLTPFFLGRPGDVTAFGMPRDSICLTTEASSFSRLFLLFSSLSIFSFTGIAFFSSSTVTASSKATSSPFFMVFSFPGYSFLVVDLPLPTLQVTDIFAPVSAHSLDVSSLSSGCNLRARYRSILSKHSFSRCIERSNT